MSLVALLKPKGPSGFGYGSTAEEVTQGLDLTGKTYLLTGCNSGLGFETMRVLALRGATVIGSARTQEKAEAAASKVQGDVISVACELSEPSSVRDCVQQVKELNRPLDGIICNAGIMALPKLVLHHGFDLQFFTNHIGHFILVTGLLDSLVDDGRVVMLSSEAHRYTVKGGIRFDNLDGSLGYFGWTSYGQSKLANLLFARELSRRFEGTSKTANAVHPGVILTKLVRHTNPLTGLAMTVGGPLVMKNVPQGAATQTYVAVHPDAATVSGEYWADSNVARSTKHGANMDLASRLWEISEEIVAGLA